MSKKYPEKKHRPEGVPPPPEGYYYVGTIAEASTPPGWLCWDKSEYTDQTWLEAYAGEGWPTTDLCSTFVFAAPREHATFTDADILLTDMGMVRDMVTALNRDIDDGFEVHDGKTPGERRKGPRMTLKRVRARLHHIAQRLNEPFQTNTISTRKEI